ncbi:bifunctional riboflavin kinase/FAD synthetase [Endozoicomonas sp. Mp262]|uniref:bifunctional riboflavin kinase/FAD synthetase n=1 Tax=Endozoicomonas sp. Mp262 TaxID=2919499 RepID=UPI0021DA54D8
MQLIRGLHNIRQEHRACVATIGNFDGVHLGHRAILKALKMEAQRRQVKACVITFEPLPHEHFNSGEVPARLITLREKLLLLEQCGIDQVLCLPFGDRLSNISAEDFVQNILADGLGIHYLIVGDDFRFGYGRKGNFSHLCEMGKQCGFEVNDTETVTQGCGRISSTRIRDLLKSGNLKSAGQLLGGPFTMVGRVRPGQQLGRTLGFPTANIRVKHRILPMTGVFAVRVKMKGAAYDGVANLGVRPTVTSSRPLLEVHLLDFRGDLYGMDLTVEFIEKLRSEQKFASLDALRTAIAGDVEQARGIFGRKRN